MLAQNIEILFFYRKLHALHEKEQRKKLVHSISKHDRDKIVNFWRHIILKGHRDEEALHATYVVKQILIQFSATDKYLSNITLPEIDAIAAYMEQTKHYEDCINIIDILFLERGVDIFSKGEKLFKVLIQHFQFLQNDEVREMVAQILTELMRQNKALIKYANSPYYFLQYLLHLINQEQDQQRIIYWFDIAQSLYLDPQSKDHLFSENDFRILVDILVRNIENYRTQQQLIKLIQAYLVFSICPFIVKSHQYYKLEQIIIVLNDIPNPNEAIKGYTNQLRALAQEQL